MLILRRAGEAAGGREIAANGTGRALGTGYRSPAPVQAVGILPGEIKEIRAPQNQTRAENTAPEPRQQLTRLLAGGFVPLTHLGLPRGPVSFLPWEEGSQDMGAPFRGGTAAHLSSALRNQPRELPPSLLALTRGPSSTRGWATCPNRSRLGPLQHPEEGDSPQLPSSRPCPVPRGGRCAPNTLTQACLTLMAADSSIAELWVLTLSLSSCSPGHPPWSLSTSTTQTSR